MRNTAMKRATAFLTGTVLLASAGACGNADTGTTSATPPPAASTTSSPLASASATVAVTPASTATPSATPAAMTQNEALIAYGGTLNAYRDIIHDPNNAAAIGDGEETGVREVAQTAEDEAARSIGYRIEDISGDGIPELLIGEASPVSDSGEGNSIYAVYTLTDGAPRFVFGGTHRNRYSYLGSGRFLNSGSGGAATSVFGTFTLASDGTTLKCDDYYYSTMLTDGNTQLWYYHNSTGEITTEHDDEVTADEFNQKQADLEARTQYVDMTPFTTYGAIIGTVHVQWADDANLPDDHETYTIGDEASALTSVAFTALGEVSDFALLNLTFEDISDTATHFSTHVALTPTLNVDAPIEVRTDLGETTPVFGFQYSAGTDANGDAGFHRVALSMSGKDGSLVAQEAQQNSFDFILGSD